MASLTDQIKAIFGKAGTDVAALLADQSLQKAAQDLKASEIKPDLWTEGRLHGAPGKEEIKTGVELAATGGDTEKANTAYSRNAPQHGVALDAEKLVRHLSSLGAASKAQTDGLLAVIETQQNLSKAFAAVLEKLEKAATAKADHEDEADEEDEEDEEESEEESEVVEINAAKAKKLISKAKILIKAAAIKTKEAKAAKADMEEEEEKACKAAAKSLRARAAKLLAKARTAAYAADSAELKKSVRIVAAKADINVVQEEEEDEEEEEEEEGEEEETKAKAAAEAASKAAKAKTDDKGHQADSQDPANGNQAAHAKAIADKMGDIDKALAGLTVLKTDIQGLIDTVSGRSRPLTQVPDIAKATAVTPQGIALVKARVFELEENEQLGDADVILAKSIITQFEQAQAGKIPMENVKARIEKANASVRALFVNLSPAA